MSLINENRDFGVIAELIPNNASVIDVGCNDGSLLEYLREYKNIDGRGMEIDQKKVQLCLAKGISVIEGDADTDLYDYPDNHTNQYLHLLQLLKYLLLNKAEPFFDRFPSRDHQYFYTLSNTPTKTHHCTQHQ